MPKHRHKHTIKPKTAFYRLFVAIDDCNDKEEVYAKQTTYKEAIQVANEYKRLDVSLILVTGRTPTNVAYKFDGNRKAMRS